MRNTIKLLATAAAIGAALPASAAPTLTSATVSGPTGTVWDTVVNGYYTLFLQMPFGNTLNPNDEAVSSGINGAGATDYTLSGDGWPTEAASGNSDPFYNLTLTLTEGATTGTLSGIYDPTAGLFTATSGPLTFGSGTYALTDFAWTRSLSNLVGQYSVGSAVYPGQSVGSLADYLGAFTVSAVAVPEPSSWGLMILGLGAVGGAMRTRSRKVRATIA